MKVLIVGAGPAGLSCALKASNGNSVTIIDKNAKIGRKLYISGKGRCNVTNNCSVEEAIKNVVSNSKFLYSSLNYFSTKDTIDFFENHGVPLVCERGNRVFPKSYKSSDIIDCLFFECKKAKVNFLLSEIVQSIDFFDNMFHVKTSKQELVFDCVVIATGGLSYPSTGSTGDGYNFAKKFGHSIIETKPALCGLKIEENIPEKLNGFTLKKVSLNVYNKHLVSKEFGELSFYKNYLDGPISLTTSSLINRYNPKDINLEIDLKPALTIDTLCSRIARDISSHNTLNTFSLLKGLMPVELIPFFASKSSLNLDAKCKSLQKKDIEDLAYSLKHFHLKYLGLCDYDRAIVTAGGVNVKEIDPRTMESKIFKNLYFVGEVLDIDAFTGGFNIQIAFSTGSLAGNSIAKKGLSKA